MKASRLHTRSALTLLLGLAACGGGGDSDPPTMVSTVAYVVTECHQDARTASARQRLQVVRGDAAPVTVAEIPTYGRLPALGQCPLFGGLGNGTTSAFALAFQRLAVSADGIGVVFEVTFRNSLFTAVGVRNPLTAGQEGIFFVRADGTGLRRLGDPSREPATRLSGIPGRDADVAANIDLSFAFSPNGRAVTFLDRGLGPAGDAAQVAILDLATGKHMLLTHLADVPPDPANPQQTSRCCTSFNDDATIRFGSRTNPDGLNADALYRPFTVKTDGTELTAQVQPALLPGSQIDPESRITLPLVRGDVLNRYVDGTPDNPIPMLPPDAEGNRTRELFVLRSDRVLQLTNFHRIDTADQTALDSRSQRVFFTASANPFGTNPSENCQVFSVDTLGVDLRELTHFRAADHSQIQCLSGFFLGQTGCFINDLGLDLEAGTLIFSSNCDPFGTNSSGGELFAMGLDGTGLRQLTTTRGLVTAADGSVDVELPGPFAYSAGFSDR